MRDPAWYSQAGKVFRGCKEEIFQRYYNGMEGQLGVLGLVFNRITRGTRLHRQSPGPSTRRWLGVVWSCW